MLSSVDIYCICELLFLIIVFQKGCEPEVIYILSVFAMAEGRFRLPKTIQEEELSVERAVSKSTRCKNKWVEGTFEDWQRVQSVKFPILEVGGVFKEYKLHKVQPLTVPVTDTDALTLNYWLSKLFNLFKRSVCNLKCFSWPFFIKNQ